MLHDSFKNLGNICDSSAAAGDGHALSGLDRRQGQLAQFVINCLFDIFNSDIVEFLTDTVNLRQFHGHLHFTFKIQVQDVYI